VRAEIWELGFWIWNLEDGKWEAFEAKIEQGGWEDWREAILDFESGIAD
jgi:hypothetical protein